MCTEESAFRRGTAAAMTGCKIQRFAPKGAGGAPKTWREGLDVRALGNIVAEGRGAVPQQFLTDMTVNRVLTRGSLEIGEEFLDDGCGLDVFDNNDARYVIVYDRADGAYLGSARLLPTVGPNMLRDAVPYLLEFGETVVSPGVWELSRICTMTNGRAAEGRRHDVDAVVGELVAAAIEAAVDAGVRQVVCVADDSTFDILERVGCLPRLLRRPELGPNRAPHVALLDVSELSLRRILKIARSHSAAIPFGRKFSERS
jgi:N-acyl-L-homoserine lactone synthetase